MKTKLLYLAAFVVIAIMQSFVHIGPQKSYYYYELKENESIPFNNGPHGDYRKTSSFTQHGAYDGTRYTLRLDSLGNLTVLELRASYGINQSQIEFSGCFGNITRKSDTIIADIKTLYNKLYLFSIKKNGIIDSFAPFVKIKIISQTLSNALCPSLLYLSGPVNFKINGDAGINPPVTDESDGLTYIISLPRNIKPAKIFKPVHKKKTIGLFSLLSITDSNGKSKNFPAGNYVLVGGNTLSIE